MKLTLVLPLPVSVNRHYSGNRSGRKFLSKASREYETAVFHEVQDEQADYNYPGEMTVKLAIYPRKGYLTYDIDNYLKCLLDALEAAGVYTNDKNIVDLHIMKKPYDDNEPEGCVVIQIESIKDEPRQKDAETTDRRLPGTENKEDRQEASD